MMTCLKTPYVYGYYGCDCSVGSRLIMGKDRLKPIKIRGDRLSPSIILWEDRYWALKYAGGCPNIKNPCVIGVFVELGNFLNLIQPVSLTISKENRVDLHRLFDTVLCTFHEGKPLFDQRSSASKQYNQIRVFNPLQIKGYFRA